MPIMVQIAELDLFDAEGRPIFRDLHFRLRRGEWAALIDPEGPGRRALIQLLCGGLRPQRGQILVDDRNVIRLSPKKLRGLRRRMGIVPEGMDLPQRGTLEDRLVFKLRALDFPKEEALARAEEVLELIGLSEKAHSPLQALDGLERGLFRLALALSHDPVFLLLDNPLGDLPPEGMEPFLEVLERVHLRRRLTILMTAEAKACALERHPITLYELREGRLQALQAAPLAQRHGGSL